MTRLTRPLMASLIAVSALVFGALLPMVALAFTAPGLGTAASYAILAGTPKITNTGDSVISGSVGIWPAEAIDGFPPGIVTNGTKQAGTGAAKTAQSDLTIAYLNAAGQTPCTPLTGDLGGKNLAAGLYCYSSEAKLTGTLILTGAGPWVFQIGSQLTAEVSSRVHLINGANPCQVFWQVTSTAVIKSSSAFVGTIMALTSVTMGTRATLEGRALARNGSVTLLTNRIIQPGGCGYNAPPVGTSPGGTLPASLGFSLFIPSNGVPPELRGEEFPWLLVIGAGAGLGATGLVLINRRRRRHTA